MNSLLYYWISNFRQLYQVRKIILVHGGISKHFFQDHQFRLKILILKSVQVMIRLYIFQIFSFLSEIKISENYAQIPFWAGKRSPNFSSIYASILHFEFMISNGDDLIVYTPHTVTFWLILVTFPKFPITILYFDFVISNGKKIKIRNRKTKSWILGLL